MEFTLITTEQQLIQESKHWTSNLGIDLECENNLHHYGAYISLIQISTKKKNWIVDVLSIKDISTLIKIFHDDKIQKIFHDVSFDLRILHHQFSCRPKNVFDTQLAAQFIGKTNLSLSSLLEEYFNIKKQPKFQMSDWTKRPISSEMLAYASKDTQYLIPLRDILSKKLKELKRSSWVQQECKHIEQMQLTYQQGHFFTLRGLRTLTAKQLGVLKELYDLREYIAEKVDRPVHFIINTKRLFQFAITPPNIHQWANLKGVHPIVRRYAKQFYNNIKKAKPLILPFPKKYRYTIEQRNKSEQLNKQLQPIAEKLGLPKHLILNKDQIKNIILENNYDSLRPWQKELIKKENLVLD